MPGRQSWRKLVLFCRFLCGVQFGEQGLSGRRIALLGTGNEVDEHVATFGPRFELAC